MRAYLSSIQFVEPVCFDCCPPQDYTHHMAVLQPALSAAGLGGACHMSVEWARAVREAVKAVMRSARLPALVEVWERGDADAGDLWAAQVGSVLM